MSHALRCAPQMNLLEEFYKNPERMAYTFQNYVFLTRVLQAGGGDAPRLPDCTRPHRRPGPACHTACCTGRPCNANRYIGMQSARAVRARRRGQRRCMPGR